MKGLSLEEIEELLAAAPARTPQERQLKQRCQARVAARQGARSEDLAQAPKVRDAQRVYETVGTILEIRREYLDEAYAALGGDPETQENIASVLEACQPPVLPDEANRGAEDLIKQLLAARDTALDHAARCSQALRDAAASLGAEHELSAGLIAAASFPD